jgi:hypothetical protein
MFNFSIPLWLLPVIMYVIGQLDIAFHGNTGFAYVSTLVTTLALVVFVRKRPVEKIAVATATVIAAFLPLFSLYIPTFGNDTWRDLLWAREVLIQAFIPETIVKSSPYPFPILPLTYAIVSLQTGLDLPWTSVLLGVAYLYLLSVSVYLLSLKITRLNDFSGAFLLLTVPLVVVWSIWYIPQVHAIMLYLISMLLPSLFLQIILLLTASLTHGGMALLMSLILFLLWIATSEKKFYVLLLANIIISIINIVYTSLIYAIVWGYRGISGAIMAFVLGMKRVTPTVLPQLPPPFTVALSWFSLIILGILSFLVFLYKDKNIKILIAGVGSLLVAGYVGIADFDVLRYLGLPSLIILSIFIPYIIRIIYSKMAGTLYIATLFFLSIFSFAYAGTFAPGNPYTANPYSYSALSGLLEYNEAINLHQIIELVTSGVYFIDWRGGAYLVHSNFDVQPTISGFRYKDVEFVIGGIIGGGWGYDIKKLINYNCSNKWLLIIRHRIYENYYYYGFLTSIHLCNDISTVLDSNTIKIYKT